MPPATPGTSGSGGSLPRARRSFWTLVVVAVLAAGWLSVAVTADPGPVTGLQVATSGLLLSVSMTLAARVLVSVERARRRSRQRTGTKE
jgi:hypothetical protein